MLRTVLVPLAGLLTVSAALAQTPRVPYLATVQEKQAYVRSGPGQHYYPTGLLKQGAVVEVYRHDPGGWLAIRPPVGSFSWVRAEAVRLVDVDVGEIIRDGELARIGSTLSPTRQLWQVKLRKGEKVAIIERVDEARGSWYKIEPPAGEFRWIYHRSVAPLEGSTPPVETGEPPHAPRRQAAKASAVAGQEASAPGVLQASAHAAQVPATGDRLRPPSRVAGQALRSPEPGPGAVPAASALVPVMPPDPGSLRGLAPSEHKHAKNTRTTATGDTATLEAQLDRLDLELSHQVCRPRGEWKLEPLRRRAEALVAAAGHPTVRARARELLKRIERFELIRQARLEDLSRRRRLHQLAAAGSTNRGTAVASTEADSPSATQAAPQDRSPRASSTRGWTAATTMRRYDARGQLVPVRSRGFDGPHYAVVDPVTGKVRAYVSAAPGINLRRFVGQTVGVIGIQEVVPRLDAKHVAARRVELLEGTQRR